jgi:hypothetical protein
MKKEFFINMKLSNDTREILELTNPILIKFMNMFSKSLHKNLEDKDMEEIANLLIYLKGFDTNKPSAL